MQVYQVLNKKPRGQSIEFPINSGTKIEKIQRKQSRDPLLTI